MALKDSPILRRLGSWLKGIGAVEPNVKFVEDRDEILDEAANVGMTSLGIANRFYDDKDNVLVRKIQRIAEKAEKSNPLAGKAIRLRKNFVCGEGFRLESETGNPLINKFLEEHWEINWEGRVEKRCESLSTYGELAFWQPPCNPHSGHFELGAIPRNNIESITTDPMNAEKADKLVLEQSVKLHLPNEETRVQKEFQVYGYDWLNRQYEGEVWYLGVNNLDQQHRGISDLAPILDWLEVFDQLVYTESERAKLLRSLLFHLQVEGATSKEVQKLQKKLSATPPPPGTWLVSNEKWIIKMIEGGNGAAPFIPLIEYVFGLCAGFMDMPEHYYFSAGDVNRASGEQMKAPIFAGVRTRKTEYSNFMRCIAQNAVDQAVKNIASLREQTKPADRKVKVTSRDPERDSFELIGKALNEYSKSLLLAQTEGWLSSEQAGDQYRKAASSLGLEEIEDPENLDDARKQVDEKLERVRPQLEESYPLSPTGKKRWALAGK